MTARQRAILQEALGFFDHPPRQQQNYYVAEVDAKEWKDVLVLEYLGYLERRFDGGGNLMLFRVTELGKLALADAIRK